MRNIIVAALLAAFVILIAMTMMFGESKPKVVVNPVPKNLPVPAVGGAGSDEGGTLSDADPGTPSANSRSEQLISRERLGKLSVVLTGESVAMPAVNNPESILVSEATFLADEDLVLGVVRDKQARAYPLANLSHPELAVVNDQLGDEKLTITWNAVNRTAAVFDVSSSEIPLTFQPGPNRWLTDLNFRDSSTESWWSQILGSCVYGQLRSVQLRAIPTLVCSWRQWKKAYPESQVARFDKRVDDATSLKTSFVIDNPRKDRVFILRDGGNFLLLPFEELFQNRVIHTRLGDQDLVVFYDDGADSAVAYRAALGSTSLRFEWRGLLFVVENTDSIWNIQTGKMEDTAVTQPALARVVVIETTRDLWDAIQSGGQNSDSPLAPTR